MVETSKNGKVRIIWANILFSDSILDVSKYTLKENRKFFSLKIFLELVVILLRKENNEKL